VRNAAIELASAAWNIFIVPFVSGTHESLAALALRAAPLQVPRG
jgi:hypothetical protein